MKERGMEAVELCIKSAEAIYKRALNLAEIADEFIDHGDFKEEERLIKKLERFSAYVSIMSRELRREIA